MKSYQVILAVAAAAILPSCVEPGPHPRHHRAGYSAPHSGHATVHRAPDPRSRYTTDRRDWRDPRNPRSPYSPGGSVVLPSEARRIDYRGRTYYRHRNTWYQPSGSGYIIVAAPY